MKPPRAARVRPPGPVPTAMTLREAALRRLARFSATQTGLVRVLNRRIDRWARAADGAPEDVQAAQQAARTVAAALVEAGVVDDKAFAAARARRLARAGRSTLRITAHLAERGVAPEDRPAPPNAEAELAAALAYASKRRLADKDPAKAMGALARAGFGHDVARRALAMTPDEARDRVLALKAG